MLAIGRWKAPIEKLASLGYARRMDQFNYVITRQGQEIIQTYDKHQSDDYLRIAAEIKRTRERAIAVLEEAAKNLAEACQLQHKLTGEVPNQVTFRFGQDVIKRALELIG